MKKHFITVSILFALSVLFISCETEDETNTNEESNEISTAEISGFLNSKAYNPATIQYEKNTLFDDKGYTFKLFEEVKICDEFQSNGEISFFVISDTELTPGKYDGKGPFFNFKDGEGSGSSSFFGAEVIIESVSESQIIGRVKGGDGKTTHNIEGRFTAELCQKK